MTADRIKSFVPRIPERLTYLKYRHKKYPKFMEKYKEEKWEKKLTVLVLNSGEC